MSKLELLQGFLAGQALKWKQKDGGKPAEAGKDAPRDFKLGVAAGLASVGNPYRAYIGKADGGFNRKGVVDFWTWAGYNGYGYAFGSEALFSAYLDALGVRGKTANAGYMDFAPESYSVGSSALLVHTPWRTYNKESFSLADRIDCVASGNSSGFSITMTANRKIPGGYRVIAGIYQWDYAYTQAAAVVRTGGIEVPPGTYTVQAPSCDWYTDQSFVSYNSGHAYAYAFREQAAAVGQYIADSCVKGYGTVSTGEYANPVTLAEPSTVFLTAEIGLHVPADGLSAGDAQTHSGSLVFRRSGFYSEAVRAGQIRGSLFITDGGSGPWGIRYLIDDKSAYGGVEKGYAIDPTVYFDPQYLQYTGIKSWQYSYDTRMYTGTDVNGAGFTVAFGVDYATVTKRSGSKTWTARAYYYDNFWRIRK